MLQANKKRVKVKVNCTLVQALRLYTGRTAHRGVEVLLYPFMTMALEGGEGSVSCPGCSLPPGKDPVHIVQEAGWNPGLVWTVAENLAPTGIRSPDRPAHSQCLPTELSWPTQANKEHQK